MTTRNGASPLSASSDGGGDAEELFREFARTRSEHLRERLIAMHQNLVRFLAGKFANKFANGGEPLEDLVQIGMIGLAKAVDDYDPERGGKFSTYATPTIVGELRWYFRDLHLRNEARQAASETEGDESPS